MKADFQVGIIGAGFAGLVAALRLKKSGRNSFVIFERASEVGGTWRDNIYPGCACDVASPLYSFADEPKPDWSRLYAEQPEILQYIKDVVDKRGLEQHIRFNSDIVEAKFMEEEGCWLVSDRQGRRCRVSVLLPAMGPLNRPHYPQFPGMEQYRGKHFHSAEWDSSYTLKGKRVAVIGTGASAIQIVPAIAPEVAHLLVVQRTPAWISPRNDHKISAFGKSLYRRFPLLQQLRRGAIYRLNELIGLGFIGHKRVNSLMASLSLRKLKKEVKDPEIRKKLTPDYTIGCKRILRSDDFYPTFNRPNVSLVSGSIERFTEKGFITGDGKEHQLDAVIFATGFVAAEINFYTRIIGKEGKELTEGWKDKGAEAYLGTTVAGYPNMAIILGPNTGLGHNSVILMMEAQMNYIMQYLGQLEKSGEGTYLDVKESAQQVYNTRLQQQFGGTVWTSGCHSWYMNAQGKNTTLYPRLVEHFRQETKKFYPQLYQIVQPAAKEIQKDSLTV